jgi:EF-hand domain pair/EF hand
MFKFVILGCVSVAVLSVPVFAQQTRSRTEIEARVKQRFAKLDANHDGAVTADEGRAARQERRAEMRSRHFEAMDTNRDGSVSRAEFDGAGTTIAARRGAGGHRGGAGRGGHGEMGGHADANRDGTVTLSEMTSAALTRFDRLDRNKDGTLTPEERRAGIDAMRGQRGGGAERF